MPRVWVAVVLGLFVALLVGSWASSLPSVRYLQKQPELLLVDSEAAYRTSGAREIGELGRSADAEGVLRFRALSGQPVIRWQLDLPEGADRVRVAARLDVDGVRGIRPGNALVALVLRQWDRSRYDSYLLAGLSVSGDGLFVERVARVWRPDLPFVLELKLAPEGGSLRLHDLRVEALGLRTGAGGVQAFLLLAWLGLILVTWGWLSRPASRTGRVILWSMLALLLGGMLAPGEVIQWVDVRVAPWLALLDGGGGAGRAAVLAHFVLFGALAAALLRVRRDLAQVWLLGILACIAVATEFMQMLTENRHADATDVLVNLAGIGVAALLVWIWWGRRAAAG